MYDLSSAAGVGWDSGSGARELLDNIHIWHKLLHAGHRKYRRNFGTSTAIQNYDGSGGMHDQCSGSRSYRHLSDAELSLDARLRLLSSQKHLTRNKGLNKERDMSVINPEAAEPSVPQAFEQSDRNPPVANWGGTEAEGGQTPSPAASEGRVTQPGPAPSANAGLQNYDTGDSADAVRDEAERES